MPVHQYPGVCLELVLLPRPLRLHGHSRLTLSTQWWVTRGWGSALTHQDQWHTHTHTHTHTDTHMHRYTQIDTHTQTQKQTQTHTQTHTHTHTQIHSDRHTHTDTDTHTHTDRHRHRHTDTDTLTHSHTHTHTHTHTPQLFLVQSCVTESLLTWDILSLTMFGYTFDCFLRFFLENKCMWGLSSRL